MATAKRPSFFSVFSKRNNADKPEKASQMGHLDKGFFGDDEDEDEGSLISGKREGAGSIESDCLLCDGLGSQEFTCSTRIGHCFKHVGQEPRSTRKPK